MVWVGQQGLTDNVLAEIDQALSHHELLKVKIRVGDRLKRNQIVAQVVDRLAAETVQQTGNVAIFWRQNPDQPSISLP
ncbi:MAG TPA: YhbY family RNA-binding protein [Gammaproteobacteria bacterium]|nr:YhbY family RNA-binding protein [Gammaproteobacteria bacterium]